MAAGKNALPLPFFQDVFGVLVLFNLVFLGFVRSLCSRCNNDVVWRTFEFLSSHRDKPFSRFEREEKQFTIFAEIFHTKNRRHRATSRISMRGERRCSEFFRRSLVSQLDEIPFRCTIISLSLTFPSSFSVGVFSFIFRRGVTVSAAPLSDSLPFLVSAPFNATRLFLPLYSSFFAIAIFQLSKERVQILLCLWRLRHYEKHW